MSALQRKDAFSAAGVGSGGLFSDTKTMATGSFLSQAPKPSLFGSTSTPATTGGTTWGAPATTTASTGGSLFAMTSSVTTTAPSQGGGLFPTSTVNPTPTTTSGSLFGPSNPTQGSSLFPPNPSIGASSAFQTPQKQSLFGPTTTIGTPALGGGVINPNPIISTSIASGLSGSIPGSTPSWPAQPTSNLPVNNLISGAIASAFAPGISGVATTNPSLMNPYQTQPTGILNSIFPTPQQLSSLFTPSGVNQVSTNKQLNLLNNPSLQTNGSLSSALANWYLDANKESKKTNTQQLISAPLIELLVSPAFKQLIPIIKEPPTFLRKLPNQFLNNTPTFYDSHQRPKSPPLAMDFSGCRHLSATISKNNTISPYEDLYKQVSFYSSQKRSKVPQQNKVDPYSNTLKSIFDYKNPQKGNKRLNYYSYSSFGNQQQQQTLYANQKQLLKSFKFMFSPSIQKLKKTPKQNLQSIHNFKVSNQYGSVQFNKPIDILYKNFDDLIHIDQDSIQINPPLIVQDAAKGYNDVILTFYNYSKYLEHIKGNIKAERKFEELMHKTLDRLNMQFISFDKEQGNLVVKI